MAAALLTPPVFSMKEDGLDQGKVGQEPGAAFCWGRASWHEEARPPPVPSLGPGPSGSREG